MGWLKNPHRWGPIRGSILQNQRYPWGLPTLVGESVSKKNVECSGVPKGYRIMRAEWGGGSVGPPATVCDPITAVAQPFPVGSPGSVVCKQAWQGNPKKSDAFHA